MEPIWLWFLKAKFDQHWYRTFSILIWFSILIEQHNCLPIVVTNFNQSLLIPSPFYRSKLNHQNLSSQSDIFHRSKRDAEQEDLSTNCLHDHECWNVTQLNSSTNETMAKCIEGKCQVSIANETMPIEKQNHSSKSGKPINNSLRMLPIMIILGIMFVGMCVAMNMFSRARFKNNRSIFSNPRILKLANANQSTKHKTRTRRHMFAQAREQAASHHARHNKVSQASDESVEVDTVSRRLSKTENNVNNNVVELREETDLPIES